MKSCKECIHFVEDRFCTNENSSLFRVSGDRPKCDLFEPKEPEKPEEDT